MIIISWLTPLSVFALYQKSRIVGAILITYLTAELGVALWVYGTPGSHR